MFDLSASRVPLEIHFYDGGGGPGEQRPLILEKNTALKKPDPAILWKYWA
jgi:hypothetical protein